MIRLLAAEELDYLSAFCRQSVFGCRIVSAAAMYGGFPFTDFWIQTDGSGVPCAALAKVEGVVTMEVWDRPDWEELRAFLDLVGGSVFVFDRRFAEPLKLEPTRFGLILVRSLEQPLEKRKEEPERPGFREVYDLLRLCATNTFHPPPWEPFYLDLSHRLRHDGAHLVGIRKGSRLTACAMTVAETDAMAIVGGVAVAPDARRQGLGRLAVECLLAQLPQSHVAVFRAGQEQEAFYQSLGFVPAGEWAEFDW